MWDRKEIKAKGKAAYRANRIACIIAALLLVIASGAGFSGASIGTGGGNMLDRMNDNEITQDADDIFDDYDYDDIDDMDDMDDVEEYNDIDDINDEDVDELINSIEQNGDSKILPMLGVALIFIILIVFVIAFAITAFLLNPLKVGLMKFFVDNATDQTTGLNRNNVGLAFSKNYMHVVGAMFTTDLFTLLWSLLFIIPGIYKSYCWRMVPYIISENPGITGSEARARSTQMMNGSKWAAFVLDLSFLGWIFLGVFTLNILNLVFTNPYLYATDAELYLTLSGRPSPFAGQAKPAETVVQVGQDDPEVYADPVSPVVSVDPVEPAEAAAPVQKEVQDVIVEFDQEGTNE